eukprot:GHRR01035548.1.p1 GENE.GHRR01035548.1~~GHRR01035548.1.p1  ORF type:complete len:620 (+),score=233.11 GHRR01035548.1:197-2056(+)
MASALLPFRAGQRMISSRSMASKQTFRLRQHPAPIGLGGPLLARPIRRVGEAVVVREAVATEVVEAVETAATEAAAQNGKSSKDSGNGKTVSNGIGMRVVVPFADSAFVATSTSSNGTIAATAAPSPVVVQHGPVTASQSATAAATVQMQKRKERTAAGTPYKAPGGNWSKFKQYSVWQRTCEIWAFAFTFAWRYFLLNQKWTYPKSKGGMTPAAVSARKTQLAVWLREGLVKLGPTFIKIGQQFSTRVDVLSQEFIKELEKLQDNVPPFETATALRILEDSLGAPPGQVFAEFDEQPIAAASLGQVHLAKLQTGEHVVVKVQRPGLKELFDIDLKNVRALAVWLQKADPKTDGAARDWVAIYDECSRILYQEIDYTLEGRNADRFRENFKNVDWVKVPMVFWQYSSPEVLVLEYVPGTKINDAAALDAQGLDRQRLARLAVESYLQQILNHGFFHADPHPGNVAVDAKNGGRLVYYDFGMMGSIPGNVRGGLLELFYGVYEKDADRCLDALITMGVLVPTGDKLAVRRTADFFLKSFQERLIQQKGEREVRGAAYSADFKPQRSKDEAKARRKAILSSIGEDLLLAANDQPFRFPATFTFVVRSFTVLDGIGKSLDPR